MPIELFISDLFYLYVVLPVNKQGRDGICKNLLDLMVTETQTKGSFFTMIKNWVSTIQLGNLTDSKFIWGLSKILTSLELP